MKRGLFRLGILAIIPCWGLATFLQWNHLMEHAWRIEQHISPNLSSNPLSRYGWPTYAARPDFLMLSEDGRKEEVQVFYHRRVEPLSHM